MRGRGWSRWARRGLSWAMAIGCVASHAAVEAMPSAPSPFAMPDTQVLTLHATKLQRDYELMVSLPKGYAQGTQKYPVVFVTDAGYCFPLLTGIERHISGHSTEMSEFIVVGLGYAKGDTPMYSRRRDYTPTPHGETGAVSDMPGRPPVFGEVEPYRQFVRDEVFPFIASHYRADMSRKVVVGQSYGALFATHALLVEPTMFEVYLIGSPSLWFDRHVMLQRERDYAASHHDMKAQVFLGVGGFEHPKPGSHNPRYDKSADMVGDMQAFAAALRSRHYPSLQLQSRVYDGEDHLTLPPTFFTHGLMWSLGTPEAKQP